MKTLDIGLVGSGFMGKGHSVAYQLVPRIFERLAVRPRLRVLGDVSEELARAAAAKLGFEEHVVGWEGVVHHPEVDIVDITAPNHLHREIAVAAAAAGKHIYCEKPLALSAEDALAMLEAVERAGVRTMVGFNYLKSPATLAARRLIEEGVLGEIRHFRGSFHEDILADPAQPFSWRFERALAGAGALGDLGAHVIAVAHALVGDITKVSAMTETFIHERPVASGAYGYDGKANEDAPKRVVENEDVVHFLAKFAGGATGVIESSRIAAGRKVFLAYEVNGSKGSLAFVHERMNELELYLSDDPEGRRGFRTILTGPEHPYYGAFWPVAGCGLGFGDMKVIEIFELLDGIAHDKPITPDFRDGYRVDKVIAAVLASAASGQWVEV